MWDRAALWTLDSGGLIYHQGLTYQPTILKLILRRPWLKIPIIVILVQLLSDDSGLISSV